MNQITHSTIIVDDEPDARSVLRQLIEQVCPHLRVCAEAATVEDALAAIRKHQPALVFLDIDLRQGNGFDVLDAFPQPEFKVVFTTASGDHALRAFKYRALHYLLKPIDPDELIVAAQDLQSPSRYWLEYTLLQQSIKNSTTNRLFLSGIHGMVIVESDEISYIMADSKYATVVLVSGEKVFAGQPLGDIEAMLPLGKFVRAHQSYLVRIGAIRKIQRGSSMVLTLRDKTEIPVSRRHRDEVLRLVGLG